MNARVLLSIIAGCILAGCTTEPLPPRVEAVYPSTDSLPENVLRMYVSFSSPMKVNGNLEHIKLLDANGAEVEGALLDMTHELWDDDQQQLTLLFDPSRVKTGLQAHERMGRALRVGETFQLVIQDLEDIHHHKMNTPYVKQIHVVDADTTSPDVGKWILRYPSAQSRDPLMVSFQSVIDQYSLFHRLILVDGEGEPLPGQVNSGEQETQWMFIPEDPWRSGDYTLYVNARLADPSGNNLNGLFDHKPGSLRYEKEGEILTVNVRIN